MLGHKLTGKDVDLAIDRLLDMLNAMERHPDTSVRAQNVLPDAVKVRFGRQVQSAYGYDFVEVHLRQGWRFAAKLVASGRIGELNGAFLEPRLTVRGDAVAARTWLAKLAQSTPSRDI